MDAHNQLSTLPSDKEDNEFLWNQFARLGEMMGDGLHLEPDGKWISREYGKLAKILVPEIKEADKTKRKQRAQHRNEQIAKLLAEKKCKCGGALKQGRSGSKVCYCTVCNARYVAVSKPKQ